ncbi:MAG: UMP kinase [Lentisphaerae bacterium GWF2_52_8]|nr:MAG: UMP kinase [Lentisphaerae bacterium GWF2_52_8]
MGTQYIYKRVLLKLSGEALKGKNELGYDAAAVSEIVKRIRKAHAAGIQIALVTGAGNLWRGMTGAKRGMDRVTADYMGMLATVMNGLCLKDAFLAEGVPAVLQSAFPVGTIAETFDRNLAIKHLNEGKVVIFAGGTGCPFFTTDTTAALRALEMNCEAVLKATKVDGVYSADPMKDKNATRYSKLSFADALGQKLAIMDAAAFTMCSEGKLPIIVFNFSEPDNLDKVLQGDTSIATVIS